MSPFHLDLILDLLHGCRWACGGCGVEKTAQLGWAAPEDLDRTIALMKEFSRQGYVLDHFEIGPTDFMTASNTREVFEQRRFKELQGLFRSTLLNTTFLDDSAEEWADYLSSAMADRRINFFHVIDPFALGDPERLELLRRKRDRFLGLCRFPHDPFPHPLLNAEFVGQEFDLKQVSDSVFRILGRKPYHTFSVARGAHVSERRLLQAIERLNRNFDRAVNGEDAKALNFYYGSQRDGLSRHYAYRNGQWYWPPILYSPLVSFCEDFHIPVKDWKVEEFETWEKTVMMESYLGLDQKTDCVDCAFTGACAKNGLFKLQDYLDTKNCIAPREALHRWNAATSAFRAGYPATKDARNAST
ncbi:MAG: hypothetical protein P4M08_10295 [Oligoflexia bacterium]|nr:hypothetical protein [Oligoflexia bacterium]